VSVGDEDKVSEGEWRDGAESGERRTDEGRERRSGLGAHNGGQEREDEHADSAHDAQRGGGESKESGEVAPR